MIQIFATFQYSVFTEILISELEEKGVTDIYAVPLDSRKQAPRLMDTLHRSDGVSFLDKAFVFAFLFSTIGASKGFVWAWGPVMWGLIGAAAGFILGLLISVLTYWLKQRKHRNKRTDKRKSEIILIVTCEESQSKLVEDLLWDHMALGLAKTK
ncbi:MULTISPECIES: hypothetical protein [Paenibacillus]|uniref:hypothetical protein n=1 Tax=Paenibacillus TaxID=44249 RepID=UPI002FDF63BC